jgi:DNA-directed RNA polymerase subunit M/transcription elongation factor TFIIS
MIDFNVTWHNDHLPPCPWCGHDGVQYQPSDTKPDARFFECSKCRRQFAIGWILESANRIVPTAN